MDKIKDLEQQIEKLKRRNKKVDANKAWETSKFRKICVVGITYGVIVLFFLSANIERPWVNALVPTMGFLLSSLTFPLIKAYRIRHWYKQ